MSAILMSKYSHFLVKSVDRLLIAALLVAALSISSAKAQSEPRFVSPDEATTGALLLKSSKPGRFIEAPQLATDVVISVSGPIARTRVTQRFENTSDLWIEGVYVFPLPDEAAVDTLKMQIGSRFIEGKIEEKKKAKELYEKAKREGKKASLLEQERPNIFTNSVANIGPGETIIVQIEYQESVKFEDGGFSLRFPMVVAPRYNPPAIVHNVSFNADAGWGAVDPVPDRARIEPPVLHPEAGLANPVTLSVDLDAGFPLGNISSSYHNIRVKHQGDHRASLVLSEETTPANRDFELVWAPKKGATPNAALFKETIEGEPYFLLMITPPFIETETTPTPREIIFVIDTSGSMGGASIRQARESLTMAVKRLQPGDAFNIIRFSDRTHQLFPRSQLVNTETIGDALKYVNGLTANGGTMMLPALKAALIDDGRFKNYLRQVVFLTDGAIGNEQQLFETISMERGDARIFTVGIGSAPNSYFMSRAAELGQGAFTHIGAVAEVADRMSALFKKLESPAITNFQLDWPDGAQAETWPSPIPDLYKGETLVVAARANTVKGTLQIAGAEGETRWNVALPLEGAATRKGVSKLWARKKIAALELARVNAGNDRQALDNDILKVALAHSLISRLTSLVAIDVTPSRPQGDDIARADISLNLPQGWEFEKVFGEKATPLQREALAAQLLQHYVDASAAPTPAGQGRKGVVLPQGATFADIKLMRGLGLIALALLLLILTHRSQAAYSLADAKRDAR